MINSRSYETLRLVSYKTDQYTTQRTHSSAFWWLPLTPPTLLIKAAPIHTPSSRRSCTKSCLCAGTDGKQWKAKCYPHTGAIHHEQPACCTPTTLLKGASCKLLTRTSQLGYSSAPLPTLLQNTCNSSITGRCIRIQITFWISSKRVLKS